MYFSMGPRQVESCKYKQVPFVYKFDLTFTGNHVLEQPLQQKHSPVRDGVLGSE